MSLSNLFEANDFNIYAKTINNDGSLEIAKNNSTTELHLGDTATPVYINEQLYAGPGTPLSITTIGSSPNANGMTLASNVLQLQPANASFGGALTTTTQSIQGVKTFESGVAFANSTPSYSPSTLNYFETFSTSYSLTGCANITINVIWTRIHNMVNLSWSNANGGIGIATTSSASLSTPAGTAPARFYNSSNNVSGFISVINGATTTTLATGNINFLTGGAINITGEGNTSFAYPGYCGFLAGGITYSI